MANEGGLAVENGDETAVVLRATDARAPRRRYDDGVKRRALYHFCSGDFTDGEIEQKMGLTDGIVAMWRLRQQPGGIDWEKMRATWDMAPLDRVLGLVGPVDEIEAREGLVRLTQKLLGLGMAALDEGALYNKDGAEVSHLFDAAGKEVSVGGMRPRTVTELARLIEVSAKIQVQQVEALGGLRIADEAKMDVGAKWMGEMLAAMDQVLGPGMRRKFEAGLRAGKDTDGGEGDGDEPAGMDVDETESITSEE